MPYSPDKHRMQVSSIGWQTCYFNIISKLAQNEQPCAGVDTEQVGRYRQAAGTLAGGSDFAAGSSTSIAFGFDLTSGSGSRLMSGLGSAFGSALASVWVSRTGGGGRAFPAVIPLWGLAMRGGVGDLELLLQAGTS